MLTNHDIDIICRDRALPGLGIVLDSQRFVAALRPFMPLQTSDAAKAVYVRYKPGMNCLVAYELGEDSAPLTVYAKAHRLQDQEKIRKAQAKAGDGGDRCIVLGECAVVVSVFPNDGKLRTLGRLADEASRVRLLQRLFPGQPAWGEGALRTLRYKPERRYVAQLCAGEIPVAVLKFFTGSGYRSAKRNADAFVPRGPFRLAARIGRSNRHHVLAYEWVQGRLLSEAITAVDFDRAEVAHTGTALAILHAQDAPSLPPFTPAMTAHAVQAVASGLGFVDPALAVRAKALAHRLVAALEETPARVASIHGDFYARQVLVRDGTAAILDLDRAAQGDPAIDLGTFIAHLERERLRGLMSADRVEHVHDALLDGYRRAARPVTPHRIAVATAVALFQLAPHPFRFREPEWFAGTEALLERASEILDAAGKTHHDVSRRAAPLSVFRLAAGALVHDPSGAAADPAMPFLKEALDPQQVAAACRRLGWEGMTVRAVDVVRYKPGRRCLIEYTLDRDGAGAPAERIMLVGKVRAKGLDETTYQLTETLWRGGFGASAVDGIMVPEPVGCVPSFRMWLQRKVPGTTVASLLAGADGVALARRVVEAAQKLHRCGPMPHRRHTMADELRILHERLPQVGRLSPAWTPRLERILAACDRLGAVVPEAPPRPIHRDFYADNVIFDGQRLYLLDLDLYAAGDPALDIGNFIAHLTEQSLRTLGDPAALADREEVMAEAFVAQAGTARRVAVHAYTTLALVRLIYISTLFDARRLFTEALMALCEERLSKTASAQPTSLFTTTETA